MSYLLNVSFPNVSLLFHGALLSLALLYLCSSMMPCCLFPLVALPFVGSPVAPFTFCLCSLSGLLLYPYFVSFHTALPVENCSLFCCPTCNSFRCSHLRMKLKML